MAKVTKKFLALQDTWINKSHHKSGNVVHMEVDHDFKPPPHLEEIKEPELKVEASPAEAEKKELKVEASPAEAEKKVI